MKEIALNVLLFLVCVTFVFPTYSQEFAIVPDSVWEIPENVVMFGEEQAKMNKLEIVKAIETDNRFRGLSTEEKYNFYNRVQWGIGSANNIRECINYTKKSINFAIENDREDLLYISNGDNFAISQYYWLNYYYILESSEQNIKYQDSILKFFETMMMHLRGTLKEFGLNSKEFLIALLSPYIHCNYRTLVENEHFGYIGNDSITTISPIVKKYIDDSFETDNNHQRYICLVNAINNSNDSISLAESYYEYSNYLLEHGDVEGFELMISSIALRSRHLRNFFDSEHALSMISNLAAYYGLYKIEKKTEYYASYAMYKMLYEIWNEMYPDSDLLFDIKYNIISTATRVGLFQEADSLLTIAENENHNDRQIEITYGRALYYYLKGFYDNDIKITLQSKKYFEKLKGSWHWYRFATLKMLQDIYFITKDYKKLEKLQNHILILTKEQAIKSILSVSSDERDECLLKINSNTIYRFSTPKLLEQSEDAILFRKSLLTSAAIEIDKQANESDEGKDLLEKYRKAKYFSTEEADYIERVMLSTCIDQSKLKAALDITTKDIKKQLDNKDLFIDFDKCDGSLIATIITKNNGVRRIQLCESDSLSKTDLNPSKMEMIIKALSPVLDNYSAVYFLPDLSLYRVNIEALFRKSFPYKEFHRVSNLAQLKKQNVTLNNIVAIGNPRYNDNPLSINSATDRGNVWSPLPGTGVEIREIDNAMQHNSGVSVVCYEGLDANEETIKSLDGKDVNVLHIATHGVLLGEEQEDQEVALLLSGANTDFETKPLDFGKNDGILLASEIENLRFNNLGLVVLSACDSGIGEVNYNDGIRGLQRAFRIAGAQTMIVSLKKVDDEGTLNFMTDFYTKLSQTNNIYKSFVYAQDNADEDTRNSFILIE